MKIRYEANNGKLFETEEDCRAYEKSLCSLEDDILIWDEDGDRVLLDRCLYTDKKLNQYLDDEDIFFMQIKSEFAYNWLKDLADKRPQVSPLDECILEDAWLSSTETMYIMFNPNNYEYEYVCDNPLNFNNPLCKILKEIMVK